MYRNLKHRPVHEEPVREKMRWTQWLKSLHITWVILILLMLLVIVPLVNHFYLSNTGHEPVKEGSRGRKPLGNNIVNPDFVKGPDLENDVAESKWTKASVQMELRGMGSQRQEFQNPKFEYSLLTQDSNKLKITSDQATVEKVETSFKNLPDKQAPRHTLAGGSDHSATCKMHSCFDYSRCSLLSGFPVYFYSPKQNKLGASPLEQFVESSVSSYLTSSPYLVTDGHLACVYVVLVGQLQNTSVSPHTVTQMLRKLPFWHGDGRNHVLLNLARTHTNLDIFDGVDTGQAIIVQSSFVSENFRPEFDIVASPVLGVSSGDIWQGLPPLSPLRRKYLLTFQGEYVAPRQTSPNHSKEMSYKNRATEHTTYHSTELLKMEQAIVDSLKRMQSVSEDGFYFRFSCDGRKLPGSVGEWALCGSDKTRQSVLKDSTFTLILTPTDLNVLSTVVTQIRLYEALKYGAVPVILGDHIELPFSQALDWQRASIVLPKARFTDLDIFVRTYTDSDIDSLRHQGRFLWETYMGSTDRLTELLLGIVRTRLRIPPLPARDTPSPSIFNSSFIPTTFSAPDLKPRSEEFLGPIERPFPSPAFQRNFTVTFEDFNHQRDVFHLYPNSPFNTPLSSEAQFFGSGLGFRPINGKGGGVGKAFNEALGGNYPREQFTVVILTYKREAMLIEAIQRLRGLPHLNKVIVVWNNPTLPPLEMKWPEIGVKVHIIRAAKNSLNNRFLPYDAIETEAVLSLDDDILLRHDEIIFGFRVWRQERDRMVGFPGRSHSWDQAHQTWLYKAGPTCELSIVLTSAAFFHKYYTYMYSQVMPRAIRDKVDEYTNCEDIAMNFLVSHITRKPPIKGEFPPLFYLVLPHGDDLPKTPSKPPHPVTLC